ncbi:hypothetical protein [Limisalsivibrio acetivorans]|uniref:hypothetical protein n=1 Tax=Limisalsivibrio acetivorans TaxID=1304888 RepID=UPI0003B6BC21|nr:hypothetical protein [Limisalsivibrio acetivorans]
MATSAAGAYGELAKPEVIVTSNTAEVSVSGKCIMERCAFFQKGTCKMTILASELKKRSVAHEIHSMESGEFVFHVVGYFDGIRHIGDALKDAESRWNKARLEHSRACEFSNRLSTKLSSYVKAVVTN